jgi:hypothetical protein
MINIKELQLYNNANANANIILSNNKAQKARF